jgi:hypothetical protein
MVVAPFWNPTLPVTAPPLALVTVAVNVIEAPDRIGLALEVTAVVVPAELTVKVAFTNVKL